MKTILSATALALLAALPAAAQTVSPSGLDPQVYSTVEIESIRAAVEDNNEVLARQMVRQYADRDGLSTADTTKTRRTAGGEGQLADWLGVERGSMSYHEMVAQRVADED